MGFVLQPYLSRGSSTPCVARTMIQTGNLVGAFPLTEEKRKQIIDVSHNVMLKLVACLDAAEPIIEQINAGKERIRSGDTPIGAGGQAIQIPAVTDLRARTETFLYNAKLALREIASLFQPLYGQKFDHRFQKIRAWAEQIFGASDHLVTMLAADAQWIERVIGMRNAVDHPGSGDGTLTVENFRLLGAGPPNIAEPSWHRDGEQPVGLAEDLTTTMENLLTLYEDILLDGLDRIGAGSPFTFIEVPESERDPANPIRFRLGLRAPPPCADPTPEA